MDIFKNHQLSLHIKVAGHGDCQDGNNVAVNVDSVRAECLGSRVDLMDLSSHISTEPSTM